MVIYTHTKASCCSHVESFLKFFQIILFDIFFGIIFFGYDFLIMCLFCMGFSTIVIVVIVVIVIIFHYGFTFDSIHLSWIRIEFKSIITNIFFDEVEVDVLHNCM